MSRSHGAASVDQLSVGGDQGGLDWLWAGAGFSTFGAKVRVGPAVARWL